MVHKTSSPRGFYFNDSDDLDRPPVYLRWKMLLWDTLHNMKWVTHHGSSDSDAERIPPGAVECDTSNKRTKLYLGRADHFSSVIPGLINPAKEVCYIPWGGKVYKKYDYEFLCTEGQFVPCTDTNTLLRVTIAGVSEQGEPLYIGRARVNGRLICGKVQRSHSVCYVPYINKFIPYKNKEKVRTEYEIFIKSEPNEASPDASNARLLRLNKILCDDYI